MKVFKLTELVLEHPITIIAKDDAHASDIVAMALANGFGRMPEMRFSISEWRTRVSSDREARAAEDLVLAGEPGFVEEHEHYWDVHNPFEDW